jgi:hypothetical protein
MQKHSAARTAAPSKNAFRPVLVRSSTARPTLTPEAEVQMLRAELARTQQELRDVLWATNAFVRSMV